MAFHKTLAHRFLAMARISAPQAASSHRSSVLRRLLPDFGEEEGLLRRILQRRPLFQSAVPVDRLSLPTGDRLIQRLLGLNGHRIRLDGLAPPLPAPPAENVAAEGMGGGMSVEEVRKVLRASQMEAARSRLRATPRSCVSYSEFLQLCVEASSVEQGVGLARSLDESGAVIVLGNVVFLRPDQVAKAIEGVIAPSVSPQNPRDDRKRLELQELEAKKSAIDREAEALVRRELWLGLGFMVVQTAGFMRLTFWELSWDVMEPICFYVTSFYFMAGYAFFLRTSRDPSFEGFFESRFAAKQKQLMRAHSFDLNRFSELKRACPVPPILQPLEGLTASQYCHCRGRETLLGAAHCS